MSSPTTIANSPSSGRDRLRMHRVSASRTFDRSAVPVSAEGLPAKRPSPRTAPSVRPGQRGAASHSAPWAQIRRRRPRRREAAASRCGATGTARAASRPLPDHRAMKLGRLPVATNVSFLETKRAAPRPRVPDSFRQRRMTAVGRGAPASGQPRAAPMRSTGDLGHPLSAVGRIDVARNVQANSRGRPGAAVAAQRRDKPRSTGEGQVCVVPTGASLRAATARIDWPARASRLLLKDPETFDRANGSSA